MSLARLKKLIESSKAKFIKLSPTELMNLIEDAERYRHVRSLNWNEATLCVVVNPKDAIKLGHDCPTLERLDAMVDASMKLKSN